ncbi:MAG: hypothetical protein LBL70_07910, partial [Treponema sp.]|nr:hypothetical protein [Treponema sp.]
ADNAPFQWASSGTGTTIEFSSTDDINIITLKGGEITVKGTTTPVMAAVIDGNATLTVDPTTAFVVVISLEVKGTLKADKPIYGATAASTITFDSGAALCGDYVGTNSGNFYASGSTDKEAATAGKTYTWAANAGGDSVAGWKAGS